MLPVERDFAKNQHGSARNAKMHAHTVYNVGRQIERKQPVLQECLCTAKCRWNCSDNFSEADRQRLFAEFYDRDSEVQKLALTACFEAYKPLVTLCTTDKHRQLSLKYCWWLLVMGKYVSARKHCRLCIKCQEDDLMALQKEYTKLLQLHHTDMESIRTDQIKLLKHKFSRWLNTLDFSLQRVLITAAVTILIASIWLVISLSTKCIENIVVPLAPSRGYSGVGYWMMSDKFYHET